MPTAARIYSANAHNSFTRSYFLQLFVRGGPGNLSDNLIFFPLFRIRKIYSECEAIHSTSYPDRSLFAVYTKIQFSRNGENIVPTTIVYHLSFDEEFCKTTRILGAHDVQLAMLGNKEITQQNARCVRSFFFFL